MSGVAAVGQAGAALSSAATRQQYQVAVLQKQQQVVKDAGAAALKLIQSAVVTGVGKNLDIQV